MLSIRVSKVIKQYIFLYLFSPNPFSGSVETEITVTGGVVGPTLSQSDTTSPINITSVLGKPQVKIGLHILPPVLIEKNSLYFI